MTRRLERRCARSPLVGVRSRGCRRGSSVTIEQVCDVNRQYRRRHVNCRALRGRGNFLRAPHPVSDNRSIQCQDDTCCQGERHA